MSTSSLLCTQLTPVMLPACHTGRGQAVLQREGGDKHLGHGRPVLRLQAAGVPQQEEGAEGRLNRGSHKEHEDQFYLTRSMSWACCIWDAMQGNALFKSHLDAKVVPPAL